MAVEGIISFCVVLLWLLWMLYALHACGGVWWWCSKFRVHIALLRLPFASSWPLFYFEWCRLGYSSYSPLCSVVVTTGGTYFIYENLF